MYTRQKELRGVKYFQLVHGYRDEQGRVRHRTIMSLGRCPTVTDAIHDAKTEMRIIRRELSRIPSFLRESDASREMREHIASRERKLAQLQERLTKLDALYEVGVR